MSKRPRVATAALLAAALGALAATGCLNGQDNGPIAWVSDRDGNAEIYIVDPDTDDGPQRATNTAEAESQPRWSPGHERLAFISERDGQPELYLMDASGEGQERVLEGSGSRTDFAWGPDGDRMAFVSDHEGQPLVYIIDLEERRQFRLSTIDAPQQLGGWSPNGDWVVFSVLEGPRQGIHRKNPGGVDEVQLTSDADLRPAYSPDGDEIAFVSRRDGEDLDIYVMSTEAGTEAVNITDAEGDDWDYEWSPDGEHIAFVSERGGMEGLPDIYRVENDGDDLEQLTRNRSVERSPRWSGSGGDIVFSSNSDGDFDLYAMDDDGGGQRRVTTTANNEQSPDW